MEVNRNNFKQLLPVVEDAIKKSCFICIDGEFTGLRLGRDVNAFDTPEEYYTTLSTGSCNFMLVQFGLCAFRWDVDARKYKHSAFNFYLFPRPYRTFAPDKIFNCQSSSIEFLASQGFDFNKLFQEGLSYLSRSQESKLRELLEEQQKNTVKSSQNTSFHKDIIPVPPENKEFIDGICKRVSDFLEASEPQTLELQKCNGFQRKLIYQEINERFPEKTVIESKILENKDRMLVVTRTLSKADFEQKEIEKYAKELTDLDDAIGFTKVARCISESGKLVIGHNMILDLLLTLNHFFAPLPEKYSEFKEFASLLFPKILDTKYMSSIQPFKDKVNCSALPPLLATLSDSPFGIPDEEPEQGENLRGYCQTNEKNHEAGYDAYITGLCFLAMYKYVLMLRGGEIHECPFSSESELVKPYLNKLYLFKTAYNESPYINLSGNDAKPPRNHVFHLTFPKEWSRSDISNLFSAYGNVQVAFIDDTSAYIALINKKDQSQQVMKNIRSCNLYRVTPYELYKNDQSLSSYRQFHWKAKTSPNSTPDRKRKIDSECCRCCSNSTSDGDSLHGANKSEQSDDAHSAPKRTPDAKPAFTFAEVSTTAKPSPEALPDRKDAEPKRRTSSGMFTIKSPVPNEDKSLDVARPKDTSKKPAAELPRKNLKNEKEESGSTETKKWKDIANAFEESDNWD